MAVHEDRRLRRGAPWPACCPDAAGATHNTDIGDGWERESYGEWYFERFSTAAYRVGVNVVCTRSRIEAGGQYIIAMTATMVEGTVEHMENRRSGRAVAAIFACFACAVPLQAVGQHTGGAVVVDHDGAHATSRRFDGEPSRLGSGAGATDDRELKRDYTHPDRHKVLRIYLPPPRRANVVDKPDDKPTRIGFHRPLPATLAELTPSLEWAPLNDGRLVAAAIVTSPGATSIRLGMVGALGDGTQIRVFAPDVDGPPLPVVTRTHFQDNEDGADAAEMLWSPSVPGDAIGVEITLPKSERSAFSLTIARLAHRYGTADGPPVSNHLQCPLDHVDVQCRADAFPEGLEDTTARVTIEKEGGTVTCSGTLVNSDDFPAPFFLTANHCVASDEEAHSIETTWFHERPTCSADVSRGETVSGGADLLATSFSYDSTLLLLRRAPPAGAYFAGWEGREIEFRDHPLPVFGIHHPAGMEKKYSSGATVGRGDTLIAKDAIAVYWAEGLIEGGSSGSGLFKEDGRLIGVASTTVATCEGQVSHYGALASFFPAACPWLLSDNICTSSEIPFFSGTADTVRQGFVRLVNHSRKPGHVFVYATDDAGRRVGPITIPIGANSVAHFNSDDLEMGNADKGIEQGVGPGKGDWRLHVTSTVDVEALAYIRTQDGFVTSMHELVEPVTVDDLSLYYLRFFNPGSNRNQVSKLRLVNPHPENVAVAIAGVDDGGQLGQELVAFELQPGEARSVDARQLEVGDVDLVGMLGNGQGKWRLAVGASQQIDVMNLLESPTGNFANLSVGRRTD